MKHIIALIAVVTAAYTALFWFSVPKLPCSGFDCGPLVLALMMGSVLILSVLAAVYAYIRTSERRGWHVFIAVLTVIAVFVLSIPLVVYINARSNRTDIPSTLERLGVEVTGPSSTSQTELPQSFRDARWGLTEAVCVQGKYDLFAYGGRTVTWTQYPVDKVYSPERTGTTYVEPLNLWLITWDDKVICAYYAVRKDSLLIPGIFSVNDPYIK